MRPDRWHRLEKIYQSALEQPEAERSAFLRAACGEDEGLLREAGEMLEARGQAGSFLAQPAAEEMGLAQDQKPNGTLIGKRLGAYEILSLLGKGGMGEVYRARDIRLDRIAALKILPPEVAADPGRLHRFVREAKAASALNHPNIATIYEIGESGGIHWIAMELVEGATLAEGLKGKRPELDEILNIGIQVAGALEEAHGKGIIHRDIKPSNIMMTPKGQTKILDFGLAKMTRRDGLALTAESTDTHTQPGLLMGTARYMSPEQVLGQPVDNRTDIFSLGAVLYEMAAGKPPFAGETSLAIFDAIMHQVPSWPSYVRDRIPEELQRVINKALEKFRELRYQVAVDLSADLRRLKSDRQTAGEVEVPSGAGRRKYVMALSIVLAAAALGVAGWLWLTSTRPASQESQFTPFPLTSYPGSEECPSLSPDGNQVVFQRDGERQGNWDIYIKQVGMEPPSRMTGDTEPNFSPVLVAG
jgi:serine/threonine protein kinase